MLGELIPHGGGDPIPLMKSQLMVGRRESCDIVLRFSNISAHHCELSLEHGYWFVKDLNSRNGTKVNGLRVTGKKRIDPGDRLSIAKHNYNIEYSPADLGAEGPPPDDTLMSDILGESLMDSAGLNRRSKQERDGRIGVGRPGESLRSEAPEEAAAENEDQEQGTTETPEAESGEPPADDPEEENA
jgi:adenylate cyclase